jgi:hypothetical protein
MSDDPLRAVLSNLVDQVHVLASLVDSIDLTKYDADKLADFQDMIDELGAVLDRATDQIDDANIEESPGRMSNRPGRPRAT